jgi:hypothetical protein
MATVGIIPEFRFCSSMHPTLDPAGVTVWLMMHQQQQLLDRRLGYSVINFPSTLAIWNSSTPSFQYCRTSPTLHYSRAVKHGRRASDLEHSEIENDIGE